MDVIPVFFNFSEAICEEIAGAQLSLTLYFYLTFFISLEFIYGQIVLVFYLFGGGSSIGDLWDQEQSDNYRCNHSLQIVLFLFRFFRAKHLDEVVGRSITLSET